MMTKAQALLFDGSTCNQSAMWTPVLSFPPTTRRSNERMSEFAHQADHRNSKAQPTGVSFVVNNDILKFPLAGSKN